VESLAPRHPRPKLTRNIQLVHERMIEHQSKIEYTYRWEITIRLDNDAEWNARIFACFVSARDPVRSAPHQRLIRIKKRVVNSRFLHYLLLLLNLLLFERLLHGIILSLLLTSGHTGWSRMHVRVLILSCGHLLLLHLCLWLVAEWLSVTLSRELEREQKSASINKVKGLG
jgi:hypothetical protein